MQSSDPIYRPQSYTDVYRHTSSSAAWDRYQAAFARVNAGDHSPTAQRELEVALMNFQATSTGANQMRGM
jgi:hypothetical protein